jgi:hypothetical protein
MYYFATLFMERNKRPYQISQMLTAVFLILALLWLTVSLPFVYKSQQELAKHTKVVADQSSHSGSEEEAANPFGNNTEEKAPSSNTSVSEEYLHDSHTAEDFMSVASQNHKCENSGIYNAFHGEVHVPPPNA